VLEIEGKNQLETQRKAKPKKIYFLAIGGAVVIIGLFACFLGIFFGVKANSS